MSELFLFKKKIYLTINHNIIIFNEIEKDNSLNNRETWRKVSSFRSSAELQPLHAEADKKRNPIRWSPAEQRPDFQKQISAMPAHFPVHSEPNCQTEHDQLPNWKRVADPQVYLWGVRHRTARFDWQTTQYSGFGDQGFENHSRVLPQYLNSEC